MADTPTIQNSTVQPVLSQADFQNLYEAAIEQSYRSSGAGSFHAQYQTILSRFDRFGYNTILPNHELTGLTFITRPKLNLSTTSLRQDRILASLDTIDKMSLPFAVRCYLDTKFAHRSDITPYSTACPFFNDNSPFIIPLSNCLTSISGWPDYVIEPETTEGGFFSEAQTFARGSDRLSRGNYDLTLTFRDIQGGFNLQLLYVWIRFIDLVTRGETIAYPEDIAARRLCYTCSIYRFVLDPSRQYITKWSKATGCWPREVPLGSIFNINGKESFIHAAQQLPIVFTANKIEYMDPLIFREFNTIVGRYAGGLLNDYSGSSVDQSVLNMIKNGSLVLATNDPSTNFAGVPYIDTINGLNRLMFVCSPQELINPLDQVWAGIQSKLGNSPSVSTQPGQDI